MWEYNPQKIVTNLPRTYDSYTVKKNLIGLAVSNILRCKETDRDTDIQLHHHKDMWLRIKTLE